MPSEDLKDLSPPKKRKNEEPHEENGHPTKLIGVSKQGGPARHQEKSGKRARVSYSCSECHRRKQKCDRQIPCGHCVARKVPELCKGYTPGKSENDLHLRIARLERIIEQALPNYAHDTFSDHGSPSPHQEGRSRASSPGDPATKGGSLHSGGTYFGNSALGSLSSMPILEQLQNGGLPPALDEPSPSDNLKSLVQECGVAPHKLPELVQELPPKALCEVLIDYYFTSINYTRYPIDEVGFRAAFESVCVNGHRVQPDDVRFLPLLFVVLAIAARLAPETILGDERARRLNSLRYYWSSRRSLLIAAAIQSDSLELVLARLLSARFLTFDRRITECWSQLGAAVRTAQALGLHRDGVLLGLNPYQTEYRRRVWSYLYHADRTHALLMGRPHAIQDEYTSTQAPMNADDTNNGPPRPVPLTQPTPWTFLVLRHSLATIIGHIVHHFQRVRTHSHYNDVIHLDEELQRFMRTLPPHYAVEADTSLDESHPYIPVHRFIIITEVFFVRISLHRPYLLRRLSSDRYALSRRACFESAQQEYKIRQRFKNTMPEDVLRALGGAYREFQAAMIAGIGLILDPQSSDAPQLHEMLDGFLHDHEGLHEMDATTRREVKIIEFLKKKAEAGADESKLAGESQVQAQANASLLMGLSGQTFGIPRASHRSPMNGGHKPKLPALQQPMFQGPHSTPSPRSPMDTLSSPQHGRQQSRSGHSTGSFTPPTEEAQNLLDNWCNSVINSSGYGGESGLTDFTSPWIPAQTPGPYSFGSVGPQPETAMEVQSSSTMSNGFETSDWNYWETIVSAIGRDGTGAA
ncbi:hypothetical protein FRC14_003878 [Serendipita sp. 396]|nr:hypothetical protein FRC14_003878 [Serendipita sp. 396]KAG8789483.1 hypothetical protein FRC15_008340 [Serendipita sp. 397]KAG8825323.1 hypothetical protein FRC19_011687 [Serendipita sp. 401]KAG8829162.1 hypothetical protein FRC18_009504 [Serendipita sp. 400]KAG8879069.1 hypothetical protein FRC20_003828 [Serendipita sp. 405]KAG9057386.1 hypothetical protein FS842_007087 [Serendipita sp. 407]